MRWRLLGLTLLLGTVLATAAGSQGLERGSPPVYVAIGDSLSAGVQPDARGHNRPTREGYPDQLARALRPRLPGLAVVHFGGGGTTSTLIEGSPDQAADTPALVQAERYLRAHRGRVKLVSLNIGDNDVGACVSARKIDERCATRELADVRRNVPMILRRLRAAAGGQTPLVGLADYDQFWAFWLRGSSGRALARRSSDVISELNATLLGAYRKGGAVAADAGPRFAIRAERPLVSLRGHGRVPRAVARICGLTWACSGPPIGFNDHANGRGYRVLSATMYDALRAAGALPGARAADGRAGP